MYQLQAGDEINWAEPAPNANEMTGEYCIQCGRKTGKNALMVNVSTRGTILPISQTEDSQGFWAVGSECAKRFNRALLIRATA
jgi:hypothetical protein